MEEDELAQILANMSEYIQPQSPLNLNTKVEQSQEHSAHNKNTSEEINNEEEVGAKATQEMADQTRVTSPEEPSLDNANTKEMLQTEDMETNQGKGTTLEEKNPMEQPSPERIETVREIVVLREKKKKSQIKKL